MFGHHSFDNYSLPFKSDEGCNYDKSEFTDWSICGGSSWTEYVQFRTQTFRNKGTPECYANLEDLVKSIVTSMKDAGSNVNYYSFPEDDSGNAGFTIEDRRDCTPGSVESTGVEEITGCMRVDAINYNPDATEDDGSCEYSTRSLPTTNNSDPVEAKAKEPVVETTSKTPYLGLLAFLVASGVLGNGVNHHYQITDRIKSLIAKYKQLGNRYLSMSPIRYATATFAVGSLMMFIPLPMDLDKSIAWPFVGTFIAGLGGYYLANM